MKYDPKEKLILFHFIPHKTTKESANVFYKISKVRNGLIMQYKCLTRINVLK